MRSFLLAVSASCLLAFPAFAQTSASVIVPSDFVLEAREVPGHAVGYPVREEPRPAETRRRPLSFDLGNAQRINLGPFGARVSSLHGIQPYTAHAIVQRRAAGIGFQYELEFDR